MGNLFAWMKSTRSIAVVIVLLSLSGALFFRIVDPKDYVVIAGAIVTAYFGKRDEKPVGENEQPQN